MKNRISLRRIIVGSFAMLLIFAIVGCTAPQQATATPIPAVTEMPVPILTPTTTSTPLPLPTETLAGPTALPSQITDAQGGLMQLVPAGPFVMGNNAGMPDEKPTHVVNLPAFYMDKFEVTNVLYRACVEAGGCQAPVNTSDGNHPGAYGTYGNPEFDKYPVIWVDWNRAQIYCHWRGARLPTEAEWEKAARGTDERKYPWGNAIASTTFANYGNHLPTYHSGVFGKTITVGSYPSGQSPYGIEDMAGNVWEWVADWYDMYPGGDVSANDAFGQQTYKVLRGGSWQDDPELLRTTFRGGNTPDTAVDFIGFRCALTP